MSSVVICCTVLYCLRIWVFVANKHNKPIWCNPFQSACCLVHASNNRYWRNIIMLIPIKLPGHYRRIRFAERTGRHYWGPSESTTKDYSTSYATWISKAVYEQLVSLYVNKLDAIWHIWSPQLWRMRAFVLETESVYRSISDRNRSCQNLDDRWRYVSCVSVLRRRANC